MEVVYNVNIEMIEHVIYFVPVDNEFVILLLNIFIFYFICTLE